MRLSTLSFLFLLSVALSKASPVTKAADKKSVSEEIKLKKDDLKIEETGSEKDRAKKSTTTFCVEIKPGASEPSKTICECGNKGPAGGIIPEAEPEPVHRPQPAAHPAPHPVPHPAAHPAPKPAPQPTPEHYESGPKPAACQSAVFRPPQPFHIIQPVPPVPQVAQPCAIHAQPAQAFSFHLQPAAPIAQAIDIVEPAVAPAPQPIVPPAPQPAQAFEIVQPVVMPAPQPSCGSFFKPQVAPEQVHVEVIQPIATECTETVNVIPAQPAYQERLQLFVQPSPMVIVPERRPQPVGPTILHVSAETTCPHASQPGHPFLTECSCRPKDASSLLRAASPEPMKMVMWKDGMEESSFRTHHKQPSNTIVPIVMYPQSSLGSGQRSEYFPANSGSSSFVVSSGRSNDKSDDSLMTLADGRTSSIVSMHPGMPVQPGYPVSYQTGVSTYAGPMAHGSSTVQRYPVTMGQSFRSFYDEAAAGEALTALAVSPKIARKANADEAEEGKSVVAKPEKPTPTSTSNSGSISTSTAKANA